MSKIWKSLGIVALGAAAGDAGENAEPDPAAFVPTTAEEDTDRVEA